MTFRVSGRGRMGADGLVNNHDMCYATQLINHLLLKFICSLTVRSILLLHHSSVRALCYSKSVLYIKCFAGEKYRVLSFLISFINRSSSPACVFSQYLLYMAMIYLCLLLKLEDGWMDGWILQQRRRRKN